MYSKKYYIGTSDVDQFLDLKLSSLFVFMQDVATEHAEQLGIGKAVTLDRGLFWVITRYAVTIIRMPKYLDTVVMKTYPGDDMKFLFPRYFQLESESGEVLVKASSIWAVVEKATRHASINPFNGMILPSEHYEGEEPLPKKIRLEELSLLEERKVRYTETDLNGHLNNTKYIEFIVDMHDKDFYSQNKFKHLDINYEKEILAGSTVSLYTNNGNPECICGKVDGANSFEALIEYQKR